jgi:hypothetical protein
MNSLVTELQESGVNLKDMEEALKEIPFVYIL